MNDLSVAGAMRMLEFSLGHTPLMNTILMPSSMQMNKITATTGQPSSTLRNSADRMSKRSIIKGGMPRSTNWSLTPCSAELEIADELTTAAPAHKTKRRKAYSGLEGPYTISPMAGTQHKIAMPGHNGTRYSGAASRIAITTS